MQGVDKLHAEVAGLPLLAHTLRAFAECASIGELVVVLAPNAVLRVAEFAATLGRPIATVAGGARRQDSVAAGLRRLGPCDFVVVHDGARPLVTPEMIQHGLEAAEPTGAAIAGVPVVDTIKEVDRGGYVVRTLDRSTLWSVQTPQVFRRDLLEQAHREITSDVTDDAAMIEQLGIPVAVFAGAQENVKVTTPADLAVVATLLAERSVQAGLR
jgi:2-C-methyl-D-erythritol 4-phosphate cytidylyltransferase